MQREGVNTMRKLIPTSLLAFAPLAVFAQLPPVNVPGEGSGVPTTILEFYGLMCTASNWLFAFVLVVAVIVLLFGAISFFTARGNEDQVGDARRYITYALVGVAVAVLSRALIFVVGSFVGLSTPSSSLFAC